MSEETVAFTVRTSRQVSLAPAATEKERLLSSLAQSEAEQQQLIRLEVVKEALRRRNLSLQQQERRLKRSKLSRLGSKGTLLIVVVTFLNCALLVWMFFHKSPDSKNAVTVDLDGIRAKIAKARRLLERAKWARQSYRLMKQTRMKIKLMKAMAANETASENEGNRLPGSGTN